ncbi:MAG: hypothetical protein ACT4OZ_16475 [Gemmatimonadota bacterium]
MVGRNLLREGLIAGILGAASVALWFFILDAFAGRPFFTPAVLGAALLGAIGGEFGGRGMATHVVIYTVFHFAAFVAVGLAAAWVLRVLEKRPSMVAGFVMLFAMLEIAFLAGTAVVAGSEVFGTYAWWQFGVANVIAAVLMGRYLWRATHPARGWNWERENDSHFHSDGGRKASA